MSDLNLQIFGEHARTLSVHRQRLELLADNLANADTPNYKARDIDFRKVLADTEGAAFNVDRTQPGHLPAGGEAPAEMFLREPLQPSADGNTVDGAREQAQFAEAAVRYRASLGFAEGRLNSLLTALTGGK